MQLIRYATILVPAPALQLCKLSLAMTLLLVAPLASRAADGVLISVNETRKVTVEVLDEVKLREPMKAAGLLIWTEGEGDRWAVVRPGWTLPSAGSMSGAQADVATGNVRSAAGNAAGSAVGGQLTSQLAQLRGAVVARDPDADFLTPARDGRLLSPMPTFRRLPRPTGAKFPAAEALLQGKVGQKLVKLRLPFRENQTQLKFSEIPELPAELAKGLPAGEWTLTLQGGLGPKTFHIEDAQVRQQVLEPIRQFQRFLKPGEEALGTLFALEQILSPLDEEQDDDAARNKNVTPRYLTDAFELLDNLPADQRTPHLLEQRTRLARCLETPPSERKNVLNPPATAGAKTGIPEIDEARALLASGQWKLAGRTLASKTLLQRAAKDKRTEGLMLLYRAVVEGEGGIGREAETSRLFEEALAALEKAPVLDRFRAANNYADYLQGVVVDRLYNHALQLATGGQQPFLRPLQQWLTARQYYELAEQLVMEAGLPQEQAALQVNLARLYAVLGDVIRTLDVAGDFPQGSLAATAQAEHYLEAVLAQKESKQDASMVRAQAAELRAQLAFRAQKTMAARQWAQESLRDYLQGGYLVGVENVQRLLALTAPTSAESLRHYQLAHATDEALRARLPLDRIGLTRAGFLARKAWVNEKIVELLLQENRPAEALEYAELARARALQDLLATAGSKAADNDSLVGAVLRERLAAWAKETPQTAALEYFLGTEQAWVFLVTVEGQVKAYPLTQADGQPVRSRDLITRVQKFLRGIEGANKRILNRLLARRGFDHSWEEEMHLFQKELIPAPALAELRRAQTVLLVPQHILHYFPFAALVVERDARKPSQKEMVRPKFLLDEPFALVNQPSLTAWALVRQTPAQPVQDCRAVGLVEAPGAARLPGVAEDMKNFKKIFGNRVKLTLEDEQATEPNVKKLLGQPGVLFLATHGINEPDRPLDSYLLLLAGAQETGKPTASGEADEGSLTAREIFARQIKSDLIVMSACYSGLGDRSPLAGDDLFGLQRSFLQAGARTVVSGLWDVYDDTAPELMAGFFARFEKGVPAPQALAESQREFLSKRRAPGSTESYFVHPYFWSVYLCAGDDRTSMRK